MSTPSAVTTDADFVYDKGGLLIKIWYGLTTESDTVVVTHGGPCTPALVLPVLDSANPTASDLAVTARTATTFTVDCEDDGNDTFTVVAFFFNAASTDAPTL